MPARLSTRRRKPSRGELEDQALADTMAGSRGRGASWWPEQQATPEGAEALAMAHARAAQLLAGGYGSIEPDAHGPWPGSPD